MATNSCLRILIIEDNLAEARLLQEILKGSPQESFEFQHVQRLGDGMALLEQGEAFDIILLDLTLPDSKGLDSLLKLQGRAKLCRLLC